MPKSRTPRELLLAALERRQLRGFRASPDAAWVLFPSLEVKLLEQTYTRLDARRLRYESATGFSTEIARASR